MKRDEAFNVLGLNENATEEEVKKSFKKLAVENHPDRNKEKDAEEKFKRINQAYQILTGKEKAENEHINFDGHGSYPFDPFSGMPGGMDDFISSFFGGVNNRRAHTQQKPQIILEDLYSSMNVTFEESVLGCTKNISYVINNFCDACEASGFDTTKIAKCKTCSGTGYQKKSLGGHGFLRIEQHQCSSCGGSGLSGEPCKVCNGKRYKEENISLNTKIPPIGDRQIKLCLKGKGHKYKNQASDTYIIVNPTPEGNGKYSKYYIEGINVKSTISVTLDKLLFGGEEKVQTVGDGEVTIKINPLTKIFDEIVIKGSGVKTKNPGNHIVVVEAIYPEKNKLSDELKAQLEKAYK